MCFAESILIELLSNIGIQRDESSFVFELVFTSDELS